MTLKPLYMLSDLGAEGVAQRFRMARQVKGTFRHSAAALLSGSYRLTTVIETVRNVG